MGEESPGKRRTLTAAPATAPKAMRCTGPLLLGLLIACAPESYATQPPSAGIVLPAPSLSGRLPLERLLQRRRSVRSFAPAPLSLSEVAQLLWAAQGITSAQGLRTAPSAGALYPLALYVAAGNVAGLPAGVYRYVPSAHRLLPVRGKDVRRALAAAALHQDWIAGAPAIVVFAAVPARTQAKYGGRAMRYVWIEAGHAAENLFLQAEDLELGAIVVGAFDDERVARVLDLPAGTVPLLLLPVGHRCRRAAGESPQREAHAHLARPRLERRRSLR